MTKLLSFLFSVGLLASLLALLWLVDILRQRPDIPTQTTDDGSFVEIILQKKKHNHVDDFCLPCLDRQTKWNEPSA